MDLRVRPVLGRRAPRAGAAAAGPPDRERHSRVSTRRDNERDLVEEAPAPLLAGLGRARNWVAGLAGVAACVPVGRRVAAADLAAAHAHAQVDPGTPDFQAFLTPGEHRRQLRDGDLIEVGANRRAHLASKRSLLILPDSGP